MKIVSQLEKHNQNQIHMALVEGKKAHDRGSPAVREATQIAGEFIAAKNRNGSVKLEEVIKSYKPDYLKKRGLA